ncbi:MAG: porin [Deltaproteobacteria bacterium]|nr:porin [Deltaproteobacteria bacterium]
MLFDGFLAKGSEKAPERWHMPCSSHGHPRIALAGPSGSRDVENGWGRDCSRAGCHVGRSREGRGTDQRRAARAHREARKPIGVREGPRAGGPNPRARAGSAGRSRGEQATGAGDRRRTGWLLPAVRGPKSTWGAFEDAARYDQLSIDGEAFEKGFANPDKSSREAQGATLGVNWYLNRFLEFGVNYEHTWFDGGAPDGGNRDAADLVSTRFQLNY